jgi:hypothetical protein
MNGYRYIENKKEAELYYSLRKMPLSDVVKWLQTRNPKSALARVQFAALAHLFDDLARIDYLSRKPQPDHPIFEELKRRADAAHDLAMSYRRQIEQMKGKR